MGGNSHRDLQLLFGAERGHGLLTARGHDQKLLTNVHQTGVSDERKIELYEGHTWGEKAAFMVFSPLVILSSLRARVGE